MGKRARTRPAAQPLVGLSVELASPGYFITKILEGYANGLRTTELQSGIGQTVTTPLRFAWQYSARRAGRRQAR
ncbi:MAG: hypothetical protein DMF84_13995 [Acidobacteria bacterium]|nr:MAG: hypothetical protein DMF84_13995 [Acidobacteriota bacterium]